MLTGTDATCAKVSLRVTHRIVYADCDTIEHARTSGYPTDQTAIDCSIRFQNIPAPGGGQTRARATSRRSGVVTGLRRDNIVRSGLRQRVAPARARGDSTSAGWCISGVVSALVAQCRR